MISHDSFSQAYAQLINDVYNNYTYECAPRGQKIREKLSVSFQIKNPRRRLLSGPALVHREFPLTYVIAESLWYLLGENRTDWIANYSSFWNNISDDGVTANSAYGARIFRPHTAIAQGRFTQWDYVKEELKRDPDSRRAVILIRSPEDSIDATKDVPCTLSLQFFIRDSALHMVVTMRSTDLILGLTNDVPAFCLFQELMALELGVKLGTYMHTSNSLHIYERHFPMCEKILGSAEGLIDTAPELPPIELPAISIGGPWIIPTAQLNRLQELARSVTTIAGLKNLSELFEGDRVMSGHVHEYWRDWGRLLLAHRAGKLGDQAYKKELINSTEFEGYHEFSK